MCNCHIDSLLQGAHIWSISDIKKSNISIKDKKSKAADAENGIWFCENHHKLFDSNLIIINQDTGDISFSKSLTNDDLNYVNSITTTKQIKLSSKMRKYFRLRYNLN